MFIQFVYQLHWPTQNVLLVFISDLIMWICSPVNLNVCIIGNNNFTTTADLYIVSLNQKYFMLGFIPWITAGDITTFLNVLMNIKSNDNDKLLLIYGLFEIQSFLIASL